MTQTTYIENTQINNEKPKDTSCKIKLSNKINNSHKIMSKSDSENGK
jgi:hypothetical protein